MILPRVTSADLSSPSRLAEIQSSAECYYWSLDWSADFYIQLAQQGFISISTDIPAQVSGSWMNLQVLAPEMQEAYAVLDWVDLHASRSMRRWMKSARCQDLGLQLETPGDLDAILDGIARMFPDINWLEGHYVELIRQLATQGPWDNFELIPVTLVDNHGRVVAGEVGYRIGSVYTSLSGFFDRSESGLSNTGKLQIYRLGEYLRDQGYAFWNLGHPYMQYKHDLGARILPRKAFLERWRTATRTSMSAPL